MILQSVTNVSGVSSVCLSYLELGGILFLGAAIGFAVCTILSRDPRTSLASSLIQNVEALRLIDNYQATSSEGDAVSGHLELGVLTSYVKKMQDDCKTAGKPLSGLQYYFAKYGAGDHPPNQGQNTIVLYPTYQNGDDHIPFDPAINMSVFDLNADYQTDKNTPSSLSATKYTSANVLNRTHMSPPREPLTL